MYNNDEKNVFEMHMPAGAEVKDVKKIRELGVVAITMNCNGIDVTFFRTDFLPELEMIAWDDTEVFSERGFHEEIPEFITNSITKTGGIFIARDFVTSNSDGTKTVPKGTEAERKMNQERAKEMAASMEISGMEACLIYGAVYDMMGRWLIATESLTEEEWLNTSDSKDVQNAILDRDCGGWTIRELFGDIFKTEWTQEMYQNFAVTREGLPFSDGEANYPARKRYTYPTWLHHPDAVARAMWSFKK